MRLHWLSPLPPVRSGVSEYSADLVPELAARAELRLFAEAPAEGAIHAVAIEPPEAFDGAAGGLAVYHMGNNHHHRFIERRAATRPGMLVLHDLVLHHYWIEETLARGHEEAYVERMRAHYGEVGEAEGRARAHEVASEVDYFQFPLFEALAAASLGVAVHNRRAAAKVRERLPDLAVAVIPMGIPSPDRDPLPERAAARHALGIPPGEFLVGMFGFLTPIKRPEVCVEAFRRAGLPAARLIALGEVSQAVDLGPGVQALGYLPYAEAKRWIAATDVFLNLRYPTAGETSASLLRLLGWGKPVVVSDYAQFREIPGSAAARVGLGPGETAELAAVLRLLAARPQVAEALGRGARRFVATEHTLERAAAAYLDFAAELQARPGLPRPLPAAPRRRRSSRTPRDARVALRGEPLPARVLGGTRLTARAVVRNTGDTTLLRWWDGHGGFAQWSGYLRRPLEQGGEYLGGLERAALPCDLEPGGEAPVRLTFRIPETLGEVEVVLGILIPGYGWLQDRGSDSLVWRLSVCPKV